MTKLSYAGDPVQFEGYMTEAQEKAFRDTLSNECCAKCRFWRQHEGPTFDHDASLMLGRPVPFYTGTCQRHAPIIPTPLPDDAEPDIAYWPSTHHRDWCGDFETA